jgi:hypothetical protein
MHLVKLSALALGGLFALTACGGGTDISGTYEGDLECGGTDVPTTLTLAADEDTDGLFTGDLRMELGLVVSNPDTGAQTAVLTEFVADVEAEIDPGEEAQEVDMDIEVTDIENCSVGGAPLDTCDGVAGAINNPAIVAIVEFGDVEYDGENTLEVDSDDCEGDITRPEP